jgi:cellulose synthase/poly-beta-1,6-N-acetylglucosamine synthase-like glycosyltransferase
MHNEENNVSKCLNKLVRQSYPKNKLEIIVVNDRSTDNTEQIIKEYTSKYPFIRLITIHDIQNDIAPKKYAIDQAIQSARGDIILLTDADGRPTSQWVKQIVRSFTDEIGMVIGYAPYQMDNAVQSFSKRLLSLEYLSHAAVAAASCGIGYPLTCVGTNMAYRKIVYEQLGGFGKYKKLLSGDDDLFLQRVRDETSWKIAYVSNRQSHVYNAPPDRWEIFIQQRIRYASKGFKYPTQIKIILILFYFLNLLFLLAPLTFITGSHYLLPFLAALFLKVVTDFRFIKAAASVLEDKRNLSIIPIALILHIPYVVFFGLSAQFLHFKWGDRSS